MIGNYKLSGGRPHELKNLISFRTFVVLWKLINHALSIWYKARFIFVSGLKFL